MATYYDYSFYTHTFEMKAGMLSLPADKMNRALAVSLAQIIPELVQTTKTLDGGGWEVVSHNLASIRNRLVVTYLLRREPQPRST
jgi:hypothetical protein